MRVEVTVDLDSWRPKIELNTYAAGLYEKWMETGKDSVFGDLADYIYDQVAEALDFSIEDIKPSG